MQTTISQVAPFSADSHIQAASKLSAAESKLLSTVKGELDRINQLATRSSVRPLGQSHVLDTEIGLASVALSENATEANAEKLHQLMIRKRDCEVSGTAISAATQVAGKREIERLVPMAIRILDDAESAFVAEAEDHKKTTRTNTTFASSASEFDARVAATRQALAEKRRWIAEEGAAAHYLLLELGLNP